MLMSFWVRPVAAVGVDEYNSHSTTSSNASSIGIIGSFVMNGPSGSLSILAAESADLEKVKLRINLPACEKKSLQPYQPI